MANPQALTRSFPSDYPALANVPGLVVVAYDGTQPGYVSVTTLAAISESAHSVTPGTGIKVTWDAGGRVQSSANLTAADVTTALAYQPYSASNPANYTTPAQVSSAVTPSYALPVTTTDATPTSLPGLPTLPNLQCVQRLSWLVTAQDTNTGDAAVWDVIATLKRPAANASVSIAGQAAVIAAPLMGDVSLSSLPTPTVTIGTGLVLTVIGLVGRTLAWTVRPMHAV